ncbi:MAG: NAD(P)-dependent alcohol dehydrogenase [Chloroflexota bacterium]
MKAFVFEKYGSADNLYLTQIDKPTPTADQILIKVVVTSFNGSDKEMLRGRPLYARMGGLFRPRKWVLGSDIAGIVEAVGSNVTEFKVDDAVYGEMPGYRGGLAEYVCVDGGLLAHKPADLSFADAAAIPQAGTIAYHGLINEGKLKAGQKVLINGAGGAGGSFGIQLAKHIGAEVTGVDNEHKLEFMRTMGADCVIDYKKEDFAKNGKQYDLILDLFATRSPSAIIDSLAAGGTYLAVGGSVRRILQLFMQNKRIKERTGKNVAMMGVDQNREHLMAISKFVTDGHIQPAIDHLYEFEQAPKALQRMLDGKALGKIVVNVSGE